MGYERQADFGTPEVHSDTQVSLTIDGRAVTVPATLIVLARLNALAAAAVYSL